MIVKHFILLSAVTVCCAYELDSELSSLKCGQNLETAFQGECQTKFFDRLGTTVVDTYTICCYIQDFIDCIIEDAGCDPNETQTFKKEFDYTFRQCIRVCSDYPYYSASCETGNIYGDWFNLIAIIIGSILFGIFLSFLCWCCTKTIETIE